MNLKQKAIEQCLKALRNLECRYVVVDPENNRFEHGNLGKKGKARKYPHGALSAHYTPFIANLRPGESAIIPGGGFELISLQSGTCSKAVELWGKGSVVTAIDREKDHVEVLRMI